MGNPEARVVACVAAVLLLAGLGLTRPERKEDSPKVYEAWIRPGTYTGFALCSNANVNTRRWVVTLVSRGQSFPIAVAPGETTLVPFPGGWNVTVDDEAHFVSRSVAFEDMSDFDGLVGDNQAMVIGAWGITAKGPVALSPPRK
jgi:hypothetical protein